MRKILLCLIMGFSIITASTQSLKYEAPVEQLVQNIYGAKNPRTDAKGEFCGVLMLHSTINGLRFEGPIEGKVDYQSGIYYIYLKQGSTKITVISKNSSKLQIPLPKIEPKATYQVTVFEVKTLGHLTLTSDPSGATVTLISAGESRDLGRTPLKGTVSILTGTYTVKVSKTGYQTQQIGNVKIQANKTTKLGKIKLKKQ